MDCVNSLCGLSISKIPSACGDRGIRSYHFRMETDLERRFAHCWSCGGLDYDGFCLHIHRHRDPDHGVVDIVRKEHDIASVLTRSHVPCLSSDCDSRRSARFHTSVLGGPCDARDRPKSRVHQVHTILMLRCHPEVAIGVKFYPCAVALPVGGMVEFADYLVAGRIHVVDLIRKAVGLYYQYICNRMISQAARHDPHHPLVKDFPWAIPTESLDVIDDVVPESSNIERVVVRIVGQSVLGIFCPWSLGDRIHYPSRLRIHLVNPITAQHVHLPDVLSIPCHIGHPRAGPAANAPLRACELSIWGDDEVLHMLRIAYYDIASFVVDAYAPTMRYGPWGFPGLDYTSHFLRKPAGANS